MFIAMNRFNVITGSQADFERVWTTRETKRAYPFLLASAWNPVRCPN